MEDNQILNFTKKIALEKHGFLAYVAKIALQHNEFDELLKVLEFKNRMDAKKLQSLLGNTLYFEYLEMTESTNYMKMNTIQEYPSLWK